MIHFDINYDFKNYICIIINLLMIRYIKLYLRNALVLIFVFTYIHILNDL